MSQPTSFAVVVTNYNYRHFIGEALASVLTQTRAARQIIVVDDGSTDGSADYLRDNYSGHPQIQLLLGVNGGQLEAFRRGVAVATADVVCFLDADDRWGSDYLERLATVYDTRRDIDFVFSDIELFGEESRRMAFADRPVDLAYTVLSTYMLHTWYGAPTSALSLRAGWARQILNLPGAMLNAWRLAADNCLVFGSSILGARKYFLPTGAAFYRIHGDNGWWNDRSPQRDFLNAMKSRALIQFYAQSCGISERLLDMARHEYLLKPDPTADETERYAQLVALRPGTPWQRWRRARSLRRGSGPKTP